MINVHCSMLMNKYVVLNINEHRDVCLIMQSKFIFILCLATPSDLFNGIVPYWSDILFVTILGAVLWFYYMYINWFWSFIYHNNHMYLCLSEDQHVYIDGTLHAL